MNRPKLAWRPRELAEATGMSKRFIYEEIRLGNLRAIKLGRARAIRASDADEWLAKKASA